jgi:glutamate-1-semialdehyde 2,1-aminomutase
MKPRLFTEEILADYRDLYTYQLPAVGALATKTPKLTITEGLRVLRNMFVGSTAIPNDDVGQTIDAVTRALVAARDAQ